jgi:oxalate decarboxylase
MLSAALLAGTAGYIDAICYLLLGRAFAANMTGNLVELGMKAAQNDWVRAGWLAAVLAAFFVAVPVTRLIATAHGSSRLMLLIEAGLIALAATGLLDGAETPVLAAAMALQNLAARQGGLNVNVGFVTGDMQQLGYHLVKGNPPLEPKPTGKPRVILTVLAFYAIGAAVGAVATDRGVAMLGAGATVIAATALLPARWTGLGERH